MNQLLGAAVLCVAAQCARCLQTVALQAVFSNSLRADLAVGTLFIQSLSCHSPVCTNSFGTRYLYFT